MMRRMRALAVAAASVCAISSCAWIDVRSLPQPGNSYSDGYEIVMEFENVLNLPSRAKVVLYGVTVGVVENMALKGDHVDVTARMDPDITVSSDSMAHLQQASVLGDIYVALERPQTGGPPAPPLAHGGKIPLGQTTSPPQLEDTIASLANFVSSGSIQRMQNTIIRLNRVAPPTEEVRGLTSAVVDDLTGLSDNIDQVDQLLDGVAATGATYNKFIPQLQLFLSPAGQTGFLRFAEIVNGVSVLLPAVGSVALGGFWLVPFLESLANTIGAVQRSKINVEEELPKYRRLFTDFFLPQDKYPAINITSIVGPDGREMSGDVQDVLRILGAMP
jgi:phospholipid/cholesterol/gamma-HCH transport system substrate-binding protein